MNENAKKWVAALRSGEYKKTKHRLRDEKGFCCLGVACDVYAKETGEGKWKKHFARFLFELDTQSTTDLPYVVMAWLGLSDNSGRYPEGRLGLVRAKGPFLASTDTSLSIENDTGMGFSEIADVIESEPEGLFHE